MDRRFRCLAVALACALAGAAHAQALTGTLKKIKDTGVVSLGIRESSVPFSYSDNQQKNIGYSRDIASRVIDQLKTELNLPNLAVKEIPITSQNRIPLLQNGTIDFECGSTTNTLERQRQAAFSNSIFLYGIRFSTRKDSGVKDFADLAGKTVATTAGTSDERLLRKLNEEKAMNMTIISAKDHAEAFMNVTTGRAVAFVMDEPLLYGEIAKDRNPGAYAVAGTPLVHENYACMMRRDDPAFKRVVDGVIAKMQTSGAAEKLYDQWFMQPIPPKGVSLNYPLSAEMKQLFKNPTDQAQY
ncbi:glutamate/aspartate ABC transporter substrate-binding protein [Burkholderia cenocepacia]|uniref:glutamate/aspartate ABC transporter substrate-binding protein n=1 Tax=Burkholderia cenocepacia TaxID=95486 RepID=UPI00158D65CD|nr:glutamate/aspartate ABC transporter substrate-binding protein [Burkholderia cenocepacia]MBR8152911.1 glutamate/aspartate ABC transporter substrate-binding protein [Burkholderia cenocepacia]MCA8084480.1 glutamate/aspartate ABC transporter substrate-binding protein [Burkholderia cenocepacia]HEB3533281.1 glutamate/aspartate ABC transporter substrate-binding protein [Burkholderia cenocepacia]